MLISAVARPAWYTRLLARLGIFRSARPERHGRRPGIGRTFQNIRLFQNMTAMENVLVGMHTKLHANLVDAMLSTPKNRREEVASAERAPTSCCALVGLRSRGDELAKNLPYGDQRRLEVARALAQRAEAPAARRADRRHEPERDGPDDGADQQAPDASSGSPSSSSSTT